MTHAAGDRALRAAIAPFARPSTVIGLALVAVDVIAYLAFVALAVLAEPGWLRLVGGVLAGFAIATLFVLGHDAVHDSLTANRRLNAWLGYLLFAPSLHNPTLWRLQHNRLHHRLPNVQGVDSWSPWSPQEFLALSPGRRLLERIYRSGAGFGLYYAVHRWWRDKFWPHGAEVRGMGPGFARAARRDFAFVAAWLALSVVAVVALDAARHDPSPAAAIGWGLVLPFAVWNTIVGKTVYLQHTHPAIPWFRASDGHAALRGQERLTVNVACPRWYGWLSHEIMEHHAHHVHPRIPCYRLRAAQTRLLAILPEAVVEPLTLRYVADTVRRCKLYDFERRCWTDFAGRPTGAPAPRLGGATLAGAD